MNSRKITLSSIFLSLGLLLHYITPAVFLGVKPDFLLVMMFLAILFLDNRKEVLIIAIFAGMIAAFTTNFPMGQIPNVFDKLISAFAVFYLLKLFGTDDKRSNLVFAIGTMISGAVFLALAIPMGMGSQNFSRLYPSMFLAICVPTAILNTVVGIFFKKIMYKTNFIKVKA